MSLTREEALHLLWESEALYYLISPMTHLPYVEEDHEMGTDEVWLYTTEEEAKTSFEVYKTKLIPVQGGRLSIPELKQFYFHLRTLGVDTVVLCIGLESIKLSVDEVSPLPSEEELKKSGKQVPPMNQALQLSGIFFRQFISCRQELTDDRKAYLQDLYEDLMLEIGKSEYFLALNVDPKDPKRVGPLVIRRALKPNVAKSPDQGNANDEGNFVALFSDPLELTRMLGAKANTFRIVRIPFSALKEKNLLPEVLSGVVVNPAGIDILLPREQALSLIPD